MRTKQEIEAAVSQGISGFEQEYMGQGPKDILVHLIDDLLLIRLRGVLSAAEQQVVKTLPAENGRDLLKRLRSQLIETTRPIMEAMVEKVTGVAVVTMHHDISTEIGEEVIFFTLARSPDLCGASRVRFRATRRYGRKEFGRGRTKPQTGSLPRIGKVSGLRRGIQPPRS